MGRVDSPRQDRKALRKPGFPFRKVGFRRFGLEPRKPGPGFAGWGFLLVHRAIDRGSEPLSVLYFPIFRLPDMPSCRWRSSPILAFHDVGITVSVQLLAFRLQDYSGVFLLTGGIGFLFLKGAIFRGTGQMLLGIGLVFLAMGTIGSAGTATAKNGNLKLLFGVVDHYPLVLFMGTALLTVALQSSTASIGLGIGLAESGLIPGTTMVPWVLVANLGITLTMMMAGWGSTEGRRLAIGSLLIKGCGALVILWEVRDSLCLSLTFCLVRSTDRRQI